jgi:hypothetical protein
MPLHDLSLVTTTLTNLLTKWIEQSQLGTALNNLNVSSLPPDRLSGNQTIGLYLCSVVENAHYKNVSSATPEPRSAQRGFPIGLDLYYQLTAHSDAGAGAALQEQQLFGLAMNALHNYPRIDDSTTIGGQKVLPVDLQGNDNVFRVTLQPVPFTQSSRPWNSGNQPFRLAAYYMVSPVLLRSQ